MEKFRLLFHFLPKTFLPGKQNKDSYFNEAISNYHFGWNCNFPTCTVIWFMTNCLGQILNECFKFLFKQNLSYFHNSQDLIIPAQYFFRRSLQTTNLRFMNVRILLFIVSMLMIEGCNQPPVKEATKTNIRDSTNKIQRPDTNDVRDTIKKYDIKSGIVRYEVILKTISVNMRFHTILYFDDFGSKECKDTYAGDTLTESNMSDGIKTYKIDHLKKVAYYLGKAHFGVEPKFGWDEITVEDKNTGKVKKIPNKMIAGKSCEAYEVKSGIATVTFAGWEKIIMLADISSPGGRSYTLATYMNTEGSPEEKFIIPAHYKIK